MNPFKYVNILYGSNSAYTYMKPYIFLYALYGFISAPRVRYAGGSAFHTTLQIPLIYPPSALS